jgi:Subtilisin inhibitor-like
MRAAVAVTAVAVLAAACSGSWPASQHPRSAAPDLRITYWVGIPARSAAAVSTPCPALARCRIARIARGAPARYALHVRRDLSCAPASGLYRDPAAACRALAQYVRITTHPRRGIACLCVFTPVPDGRAEGVLHGRRVSIGIGTCAVCGSRAGIRDVAVLTPR